MQTQFTTKSARCLFIQYAPRRPRAGDDLSKGLQVMSKRDALSHAHMQFQPPEMRGSVALDLDSSESYTVVREMDFPKPQLMMVNPANGHLHAIWHLRAPVLFGERAKAAPQKAFMDLQRQLTTLYNADRGYTHYTVKTPGHPSWQTIETGAQPYSMAALYEAMPAGIAGQTRQARALRVAGDGRHDTLWEVGRQWAYRNAKRGRKGSYESWQGLVLAEFLSLNSYVDASPLGRSQVRSLARRVAEWTWENAARLGGATIKGAGRKWQRSEDREPITPEEARERQVQGGRYGVQITNAIRRNKTYDAITGAIATLAGQGVTSPSAAQISRASGVSVSSVMNYRAAQKVGTGN